MLANIKIGRYYNTTSFVHSLNGFTKIVLLILYCIIVSLINNIVLIILISLLTILYLKKTNVPFKYYLKNIFDIKYFLLFILVFSILFKGEISFLICSLSKIILLLLFSLSFIYTTSIDEMFEGFYKILYPVKIFKKNIDEVILILTISIKFIPIVVEKFNLLIDSLLIRGINIKKVKFKDRIYLYKQLIISVFKSSIYKADILSDCLILRDCKLNYSSKLDLDINDYFIIDIFLVVLLGVLICVI